MRKVAVVIGIAALACGLGLGGRSLAMWLFTHNGTDSLPHGLYIRAFRNADVGVLLWFPLPDSLREYVSAHYPAEFAWLNKPHNGFLKPIVAVAGDTICREHGVFSVNGKPLGVALARDHIGHPLPSWHGCQRIGKGYVAVFSDYSRGSIDSRYAGPVRVSVQAITYRPFITWDAKQ